MTIPSKLNFATRTTKLAIQHPKAIARGMLLITLVLLAGAGLPTLFPVTLGFLPQVTIDTDPENMLPADHPARVFHNESEKEFNLHDAVVVGIVNEEHEHGVFNPKTLAKVYQLTEFAKGLDGVIVADIISASTTDSIENTGPGTLQFAWLMAEPPKSQAQALVIRDKAMRIPFLKNTLVSEDGKALVIYVPIEEKDIAHEVSTALREEITRIGAGADQFHIAGLPVAEDTFGIEMFIQMAISAPMAMLVIFFLMWFFFRNFTVIISPMLVAMAAALSTMALLVLSGNTVHIMSSMIPIFIMPIAVLDAVHIISDFFDTYPKIGDRKKTIQTVMGHLFAPMLFTSLTTAAGFASLALTPIPPVQVFGIFVAIGVLLAWLLTILFVPAYLMLISPKRLEGFGRSVNAQKVSRGPLAALGRMGTMQARLIMLTAVCLVVVATVGIQRINVNDNPTNWFEDEHEIRVADRVLNKHFGGTYDAYLKLSASTPEYEAGAYAKKLSAALRLEMQAVRSVFDELGASIARSQSGEIVAVLEAQEAVTREKRRTDRAVTRRIGWNLANDFLAEQFERAEDEEDLDAPGESDPLRESARPPSQLKTLGADAAIFAKELAGQYEELLQAIAVSSQSAPASPEAFRRIMQEKANGNALAQSVLGRLAQQGQVFKSPEMLRYLESLQAELASFEEVGKSNSLADIVKAVHRDLIGGQEKDYRIPNTSDVVAQTLTQYQSSHRKDDLWHSVTTDYTSGVIWVQLKSGDNRDMQRVVAAMEAFFEKNPPPMQMEDPRWFGLTYINVVWQESMVSGMVSALLGSFVIVLIMMIVLFRSVLWGLLSMVPLTLTVALIYGILGLVGKDYDMPVAVLSSLSLGLAIDYAIHFLVRSRELRHQHGSWDAAQAEVFEEPARAIARNVVIVGFGFLPLLLAPLVPYQTVGLLIASILLAAGIASLLLLPALIRTFESLLFRKSLKATSSTASTKGPQ